MSATKIQCTCCSKRLRPNTEVWLEMDSKTGRYHVPGELSPERSQGGHPFGKTCARKALKEEQS